MIYPVLSILNSQIETSNVTSGTFFFLYDAGLPGEGGLFLSGLDKVDLSTTYFPTARDDADNRKVGEVVLCSGALSIYGVNSGYFKRRLK